MLSVPALLCAAACGIALDYKHLVEFGFSARTIGEFTYEFGGIRTFGSPCEFLCVLSGVSCFCRAESLFHHGFENRLVFLVFNKFVEFFHRGRFDRGFCLGIAEFGLGLTLEFHAFHFNR